MTLLIILGIAGFLLLVGPLRPAYLATWRLTVPVTMGAVIGLVLACLYIRFGGPWWMVIAGPLLFGFGLGSLGRQWLDDNLKPPRREG